MSREKRDLQKTESCFRHIQNKTSTLVSEDLFVFDVSHAVGSGDVGDS